MLVRAADTHDAGLEATMTRTADLTAAVEHALRAPSVHNTQPWQWRIGHDAVELHADWNRHLAATDPDRRDLVISCGAALHHLEVALAARGLTAQVRRLPDREDRGHLATVAVRAGRADALDADLFPSIGLRQTDRRRMSHRPVSAEHVAVLTAQARRTGALLLPVTGAAMRQRLTATLADAAHRQDLAPGYAAETAAVDPPLRPQATTACPLPASRRTRSASPGSRCCAGSPRGGSSSRPSSAGTARPTTPPRCW